MPYFIAFLETIDQQKDEELLGAHKAYLQQYIGEGKIYAKGPFTDHSGGLIIYKTGNEAEAKAIAENDPAVKENSRTMIFKEWKTTLSE